MSARWVPNTADQYWVRDAAGARRAIPRGGVVEALDALSRSALDDPSKQAVRVWRTGIDAWVSPLSTLLRGRWVKDTPESEGRWECERDFSARLRPDGSWAHAGTWTEGEQRWTAGVVAGDADRERWEALWGTEEEQQVAELLLKASAEVEGHADDAPTKTEEMVVCVDFGDLIPRREVGLYNIWNSLPGRALVVSREIMGAVGNYFKLEASDFEPSYPPEVPSTGRPRKWGPPEGVILRGRWRAAECLVQIRWSGTARGNESCEIKLTMNGRERSDVRVRIQDTRLCVIHCAPAAEEHR